MFLSAVLFEGWRSHNTVWVIIALACFILAVWLFLRDEEDFVGPAMSVLVGVLILVATWIDASDQGVRDEVAKALRPEGFQVIFPPDDSFRDVTDTADLKRLGTDCTVTIGFGDERDETGNRLFWLREGLQSGPRYPLSDFKQVLRERCPIPPN